MKFLALSWFQWIINAEALREFADDDFLEQEDGFNLLQENGGRIHL